MNKQKATLDRFFGFSKLTEPGSEVYDTFLEELPLERIEEAIKKSNPGLAASLVAEDLVRTMAGLLDIPLLDVLEKAWTGGKLFDKYLDPENYDPDQLVKIGLKEHSIDSQHRPSIDLLFNDKTIYSIEFQLDLVLNLEGAILNVRGGNIEEIKAGQIQGSANLACEGVTVFSPETEKLDLPGSLKFTPPSKPPDETPE